jgi:hypothetical protein
MSHPKDIKPRDEDGKLHGYCEKYWDNGKLDWKGACSRHFWFGYIQVFNNNTNRSGRSGYFLDGFKVTKDNKEGLCYTWNKQELHK